MTDYLMVDQAYPPQQKAADICLVYSGGDTPHTWTRSETLAQPARYRLPTWVRSNPQQVSASADSAAFTSWLRSAGVPKGSTVCLDLETAIDTAYVNVFNGALTSSGYPVMKYGSKDYIFGNPKTSGGTFVADDLNNQPHMVTEGDTVATQWGFFGAYDLSWVLRTVKLWDVRPAPPPPPPTKEVTVNVTMPVLSNGSKDPVGAKQMVHRAQGLLRGIGLAWGNTTMQITIDGDFGPATEAAVKEFQNKYGQPQDGIIDAGTWPGLIEG